MITVTLYGDPSAFGVTDSEQNRILMALRMGLEEVLQDTIPIPVGCRVKTETILDHCGMLTELPEERIQGALMGGFNRGYVFGDVDIDCEVAEAIAQEQGGCMVDQCECGTYNHWPRDTDTVKKVLMTMESFLAYQGPWETESVRAGGQTSCEAG